MRLLPEDPFSRETREQLAADLEKRRHFLETALSYIRWTSGRLEGTCYSLWLDSAQRQLRIYDEYVAVQYALALDVIARYGSVLQRTQQGSSSCKP